MSSDSYAFTDPAEIGPQCNPDPNTIALDVWAKVLDPQTKQPTGYVKRLRMRTLQEVYHELYERLDVVVCDKCGHERKRRPKDCCAKCKCGGEYFWFIDEYFNGPHQGGDVPHDFRWIAAYPVTGGSEGHYVHVEFGAPAEQVMICDPNDHTGFGKPVFVNLRSPVWRIVRLALGKTFRGFDHAEEIAKRCSKLLGA